MNTISFPLLSEWTLQVAFESFQADPCPKCSDILLFNRETEKFDSDIIYIGKREDFDELINKGISITEKGTVLILSDPKGRKLTVYDKISMIVSKLSVTSLFNIIHSKKNKLDNWTNSLHEIAVTSADLQQLVDEGVKMIKTNIMISGEDLKPRAFHSEDDISDTITDEIKRLGHQTYETINKYGAKKKPEIKSQDGFNYIEYTSFQNNYRRIFLINQGQTTIRVGFIFKGPEYDEYQLELALILCHYVTMAIKREDINSAMRSTPFNVFITDLIEGKLTDPQEINAIAEQIGIKKEQEYRLHVISFSHNQKLSYLPMNIIIPLISDIFYNAKISIFNEDIVVLDLVKTERRKPDYNKLSSLLSQYGGLICIGKYFTEISSIPVMYSQAKDIISAGTKMYPENNIYYTDDLLEFNFIETILNSKIMKFNAEKMMKTMCRDEVRRLKEHDLETGDSLLNTLYVYLQSFGNASEAARRLYLHRNSLNKRLKKIETLIGKDLSDAELCSKLLFSCKLSEYTDRVNQS